MSEEKPTHPLSGIRQDIDHLDDRIIRQLSTRQKLLSFIPLSEQAVTQGREAGLPESFLLKLNECLSKPEEKNSVSIPVVDFVSANEVDCELIDLFVRRYKTLDQVVAIKKQHNIPFKVNSRMAQVIQRNVEYGVACNLEGDFVRNIYTLVLDTSHAYEAPLLGKHYKA